jgi:drug/metabolite transporter (DMT)-like permease
LTWLLLTILCTTSIGVVIKVAETRVRERMTMLLGNYITASLVSYFLWQLSPASDSYAKGHDVAFLSKAAWIMAPIGGFIFALNFFLMIVTVKKRGVALPVTLMRLSAIVPIIASIIIFKESPTGLQIGGMVGALVAAVMMSLGMRGGEQAISPVKISAFILAITAIGLLMCFGTADLIMKLFERWGVPDEKPLFLSTLFGFAAIFVGIVMIIMKTKPVLSDLGWGVALGVPNLFASYFIVSALTQLPAYIVFPGVAAGTVMLISLIAALIFKERLGTLGIIGIVLTLASLWALKPVE